MTAHRPVYRRRQQDERPAAPPVVAGRVPPHDLDMEAAVLSALLLDAHALDLVVDALVPEAFYSEANGRIYEACLELHRAGTPVDIMSVATWLRDRVRLQAIGGAAYLAQIADATPNTKNVAAHARVIREKWRIRQVISECQRIAAEGYGDTGPAQEWIDAAEQSIYNIARTPDSTTLRRVNDPLQRAMTAIYAAAEREHVAGQSTGYDRLDAKTAGLHDGDLTIIAARPGMGKTSFVMNLAANIASAKDKPVLWKDASGVIRQAAETPGEAVAVFSLEMPDEQLATRMACSEGRVDLGKLRQGLMQAPEWARLVEGANYVSGLPIWVDDTPGTTLLALRGKVRRLQAEYNREGTESEPPRRVGLVVIDYIQLMNGTGREQSREQEVSAISRGLKELAKELRVPVIALSQLNRTVETRSAKDKRPQLSDLRESGAIEQDADNIIFIYRDEMYHPDTTQMKGIAELIIAKQRNGPTGKAMVRFHSSYTRFDNLEPGDYQELENEDG